MIWDRGMLFSDIGRNGDEDGEMWCSVDVTSGDISFAAASNSDSSDRLDVLDDVGGLFGDRHDGSVEFGFFRRDSLMFHRRHRRDGLK